MPLVAYCEYPVVNSSSAKSTLLDKSGFLLLEEFIGADFVEKISAEACHLELDAGQGGLRNAELRLESVREWLCSEQFVLKVSEFFEEDFKVLRCILFDKNPKNNWSVTWHQDRTVAVTAVFEAEGWGAWSIKGGVHHVQPPESVLNQLVTLRVHLDDAMVDNGCLRVIPASHRLGVLSHGEIIEAVSAGVPYLCEAKASSTLVMRPLLIHSSKKATVPAQRRILHIECMPHNLLPSAK